MDSLKITGGNKLKGEVAISGAKNAALPAIAATLLAPGKFTINRVPPLKDVLTMCKLLGNMGAEFTPPDGKDKAVLDTSGVDNFEAPYELVKTMRASVLVLGPLVARYGRARISLPGGCAIGARPINLHIMGLEKMGAKTTLEGGYVTAQAKRLKAAHINFDMPTVTGTENIIMAAALAKGTSIIENAAREPEVVDLANMLIAMGARISGAGTSTIEVEGVDDLHPIEYSVIPDRIETGTFMAAAAITGGSVLITGAEPSHNEALIQKLTETGTKVALTSKGVQITGPDRPHSADLTTQPYPGFPTDMQAQFMALMCIAKGSSVIQEHIFENRFMHVAELRRMGADITISGSAATVKGVKSLKAAEVMATDLRASASLIVAALAAEGTTTINRIYHLDRGYDRIERKLKALGAKVTRIKNKE